MADRWVRSFEQIADLLRGEEPVYVRHSRGYQADSSSRSMDGESGLELPGLSANPMNPEPWWIRPTEDWVARQICQYRHLSSGDDDLETWLLTGRIIARGPDCEPLLVDVRPLGTLTAELIDAAECRYRTAFDPGQLPDRS